MAVRYKTPVDSIEPLAQLLTFAFSGKTARNRFEKAAMSERMATWFPDDRPNCGVPTDALINLYGVWGRDGEIGLIVTGTISVDPGYMECPGNPIIHLTDTASGERFEKFRELAAAAKTGGSLIVGQLNHLGRQTQSALQSDPISASDLQLTENEMKLTYNKPHPASEEEIETLLQSFSHSAKYLEKAGFDGIQLNAAHGYIFSQFLSRSTNFRSDRWGGRLENRARLLLETVRRIRNTCSPTFLVSVKINCVEYEHNGFTVDEAKQVCQWLEAEKVDMIELTGGTYVEWGWKHVRDSTAKREGYFVEAAEVIKPVLSQTKLYATGGFKSAGAMADALNTLDGIGLARPLAQDPTLCRDILHHGVTGGQVQDLDQNLFAPTALLAGSQMKALSEGQRPMDGGDPATTAALMERLQGYIKTRSTDPFGSEYGHMSVERLQPVPYSTSLA